MASARLVYKTLHASEQLSDLSLQDRYLYVSTIVHSDDDGRLKAEPKYLKAIIFPFDFELRIDTLQESLCALHNAKLIVLYLVDGKQYLYHPNWNKWQPIRKDRYKPSDCPPPTVGQPLVDTLHRNLTQPNQTEPIKKPAEKQAEFSDSFVDKAEKAKGLGVNIYQLIGYYKKRSKVCEPIPEKVLDRVLDSVVKYAPKGDKFPYFLEALKQESMRHFSESNVSKGMELKNVPSSLADIMKAATR